MGKKAKIIVIMIVILLLAGAINSYAVTWTYNLDSAMEEAKARQKPLMVDFYTDWCGWCKKLDSDTYTDKKVNELAGNFICVKVNADKNRAATLRYGINGFPTIIFLNSEGAVVDRLIGYQGPVPFAQIMEEVLAKTGQSAQQNAPQQGDESVAPEQDKNKEPDFALSGIMADSKRPKAIINDVIVGEGDEIEGAKVIRINKKTVELSLGEKKIILKL